MRVENQQGYSNICYMPKKNENNNKVVSSEVIVIKNEIDKPSDNKNTTPNISENISSHPIIYNNATIENSNSKLIDKQKDEMTDEEITYELNKERYDKEKLSEKGIEFNSKEFFGWLEEHKKEYSIPYDAPPKIRKAVKDTIDTLIKNNDLGVAFYTIKAISRGLRGKDIKNPKTYLDICNNTIEKSKDTLTSIAMSGLSNNPMFQSTIITNKGLIDAFSKIKNDINTYFPE